MHPRTLTQATYTTSLTHKHLQTATNAIAASHTKHTNSLTRSSLSPPPQFDESGKEKKVPHFTTKVTGGPTKSKGEFVYRVEVSSKEDDPIGTWTDMIAVVASQKAEKAEKSLEGYVYAVCISAGWSCPPPPPPPPRPALPPSLSS